MNEQIQPSTQQPATQGLNFSAVYSATWGLYRSLFKRLMKLQLFLLIPTAIFMLIAVLTLGATGVAFIAFQSTFSDLQNGITFGVGLVILMIVLGIASLIVQAWGQISLMRAIDRQTEPVGDILRTALRSAPRTAWWLIASGFLTVIGFILLIVPGIYLAVIFSMIVPVIALENVAGSSVLGRSRNLVRGKWWSVFGTIVIAWVAYGIVIGILGGILQTSKYVAMDYLLSAAEYLFAAPLAGCLLYTIYKTLRSSNSQQTAANT